MTTWVDFAEVRRRVSLEDVLTRYYNIEGLRRQGSKLIGPCPVHGGDSPRAFSADTTKNAWYCFTRCKMGGNQIDLVAKKEDISVREAALRLQEHFMGDDEPPPAGAPQAAAEPPAEEDEGTNPPIELRLELRPDHPHLLEHRGLRPEVIEHFGLGYCSKGILRGCIAIPIHNREGELVAYAGRRLRENTIKRKGKYMFPKGFRKERELFNVHRALAVAEDVGFIVVEGFFSAIALAQMGFTSTVATMGSSASQHQLEQLAAAKEVLVLFDGDEAGRVGAEQIREALAKRTRVRVARLPEGTEPESFGPRALRWLVRGMRELDLTEVEFVAASFDGREAS